MSSIMTSDLCSGCLNVTKIISELRKEMASLKTALLTNGTPSSLMTNESLIAAWQLKSILSNDADERDAKVLQSPGISAVKTETNKTIKEEINRPVDVNDEQCSLANNCSTSNPSIVHELITLLDDDEDMAKSEQRIDNEDLSSSKIDNGMETEEANTFNSRIQEEIVISDDEETEKNIHNEDLSLRNITSQSFKCNMCEKSYRSKYYLRIHLLCHMGKSPYQCTVCKRAFRAKWHMTNHFKKEHSHEISYKCTLCNKAFTTQKNLDEHISVHNGRKPLTCTECGETFRKKIITICGCD